MNWWEWVFSGIGVFIVGLFLQRWLKSSSEHKSNLTAQGAKVIASPVASGTGITQTISETHHHHYPQPAQALPTTLAQAQPVAPAPTTPNQRPLPNIILTSNYVARVSQVEYGVWSERVPVQDAFILQLTNQARSGGPNVGGLVKAQLVYRQGLRELRRVNGCWLEQGADMTEFRVNDTHGLMVGLMMGQQFTTVGKRRVRVSLGIDEIPQDIAVLNLFEDGTVSVQLTHADTGDVVYDGQFQLNTRPPEIIRL